MHYIIDIFDDRIEGRGSRVAIEDGCTRKKDALAVAKDCLEYYGPANHTALITKVYDAGNGDWWGRSANYKLEDGKIKEL
jgi:hypothetical protein